MLMQLLRCDITLDRDKAGQMPTNIVNRFQVDLHPIRLTAFGVIDHAGLDGDLTLDGIIENFPRSFF